MEWPSFGANKTAFGNASDEGDKASPRLLDAGALFPQVNPAAISEADALLFQLEDEGFVEATCEGFLLAWENLYRLLADPSYESAMPLLGLPPVDHWRPVLESRGALIDADFSVAISGWIAPDGRPYRGNAVMEGAAIMAGTRQSLLPEDAWAVVEAVSIFHTRPAGARSPDSNRRAWAAIRSRAVAAHADLSDFLRNTIVITPEKLKISLRKGDATSGNLVEVIPSFEDEPDRWLEMFDRLGDVGERYEIPDGAGIAHVLLSPEARTVLREIKRMPGRRVAGERAEAFVRNPFAALGPDAEKVIDPDQFERARDEAGIAFARFTARVRRDDGGYPYEVALLVEEMLGGAVRAEVLAFEAEDSLERFLKKLEERLSRGAQCCPWEGFDLEILGDTPDQARELRAALADMRRTKGFKAAEIFDLSRYSERVGGFGAEKPYYSPFIARKSADAGWFPENVDFGLCYTLEGGETVAIAFTEETIGAFREELAKAKAEGRDSFSFLGCPKPIEVSWAEEALSVLGAAGADISTGGFDPGKPKAGKSIQERKGLVVKPNVEKLDYEERRGALAAPADGRPALPRSLKAGMTLKDHQMEGVAWLQFLWSKSPAECRGALLADDMGLGKTIQLLAFMAAAVEADPKCDPFLVVAPVSLLENWKEEIEKFFEKGSLPVLTLYGPTLAAVRLSKDDVDAELAGAGVTRLLKRRWVGDAKVVLTTYETLRDLEFSLALQKWSSVICDEAQKIKNPNALVTRAAKKQNARFKIACTGTPVENTLTDIWCMFDFVQPGLLGALRDFGERYRKPIEAESEEDKERVGELRALIEPQILRRTKAEVAKDLPKKIEMPDCRSLPISERQRAYYADAVGLFRRGAKDGAAADLQTHLGLLQYLRRLCSDPRPPGQIGHSSEPIAEIERHSPKMSWLLRQLEDVRTKGEKAIVFCEFRDLQRTLQRAISERFGFLPDIINGDTSAAASNTRNRQKRIRSFQERQGFGAIVLSPLAVGFGVNIQAANHVVHFTRTWNPAKEDQATDRAYRIGQTKDVFVYYPVVVADDFITFDAKLDTLLEWKRGLSADMLNGAGDIGAADFGDLGAPGGGKAFGDDLLTAADLEDLDPDAFEAFCAILWSKLGYSKTYRTPRVGDGGVDVVAIQGKAGALIQCKSSSIDGRELGWDAVKDVVGGSSAYLAKHPGIRFSLVAATNRRFNGTAREQARLNHVELLDGADLAERLAEKPVRQGELAAFLLSGRGTE